MEIAREMANNMAQDMAKGMAQGMAQDLAQGMAQGMAQDLAQDMAHGMAQNMAQDMAKNMAEDMAQDMAKELAQDLAQDMAVGMAKDMANELVETAAAKKEEVAKELPEETPAKPSSLLFTEVQWQRPIIQYIEEPSLSALRVRAEKEEELGALEQYWKERLAAQEEEHVARQRLTDTQVAAAAARVADLFRPAAGGLPCRESSGEVEQCYSSHPAQPLLCREKVLHFSQCVVDARIGSLQAM